MCACLYRVCVRGWGGGGVHAHTHGCVWHVCVACVQVNYSSAAKNTKVRVHFSLLISTGDPEVDLLH